jgi:xylulokinase
MQGERAPLWNSHARGMFIGMSLDTERKDLIRAIFEGTGFAIRHVIETIKETGAVVKCLRVAGGGAKSRTWSQIKASILKVPVYTLDDKTGDVTFGNALIAGHAVGVYPDLAQSIKELITIKEVFEPIEKWSKVYDQLFPFYLDMYRHLDGDLKKLKSIMNY